MGSWLSEILQHLGLLIAVLAFRTYKLTFWHNFELSDDQLITNSNTEYTCNLAPGQDLATNIKYDNDMSKTFETDYNSNKHFYGTEDTAVSYEHNFAATTIGFREHLFYGVFESNKNWKPVFQGIYVHHNLDILAVNQKENSENLVKIEIPESNPHGLDIFDLKDGNTVRIFVVSHKNYHERTGESTGFEEVIHFDYDYNQRKVVSGFNRVRSKFLWSSNDVVAISKNSFIASQYNFFPWGEENALKNIAMQLLTLVDYTGIAYVEFDEKTNQVLEGKEKMIANYKANCNGLQYDFKNRIIYVNQHSRMRTVLYNWNHNFPMEPISLNRVINYPKGFLPDNLTFDKSGRNIYVTGFNNIVYKHILPEVQSKPRMPIPSVTFKVDLTKLDAENYGYLDPIFYDGSGAFGFSTTVEIGKNVFMMGSPHKNLYVCRVDRNLENSSSGDAVDFGDRKTEL